MKFTKEEAIEKLNQVLTNGGKKPLRMSERTLKGQVETLLTFISDDEMELDDFVNKVKGGLESINSNIEHDTSEAIKDYKDKNPLPKPEPPKPDPKEDPNSELLRRLKELEDRETARSREATISSKRSEIKKYLSENNVKNDKWIETALGMMSIDENTDVEERGKQMLGFYNDSLAGGEVIPPVTPKPGSGNTSDAFAAVKALRKRREEVE